MSDFASLPFEEPISSQFFSFNEWHVVRNMQYMRMMDITNTFCLFTAIFEG
jgi:hypothetical protein